MTDPSECPACERPAGEPLGVLGSLCWMKCHACGWQWSGPAEWAEGDTDPCDPS